uniref:Uncharacterized protein n=1 Tax=Anguilla anguilla TaxID=7936 RepID=A0A0E9WMV7_ANGAN
MWFYMYNDWLRVLPVSEYQRQLSEGCKNAGMYMSQCT